MPQSAPSAPPAVSGPFEEFPEEVFREVVDVNLVGTFLMIQAVGARMRRAGSPGAIVNVGSISGLHADPSMALYNASKAFVHGLTRSVSLPKNRCVSLI